MFAIRAAAFVISTLLAAGGVEPTQGWFIALAVLTGLSLFGWATGAPRIYVGWPRRRGRWLQERW